MLFNSFAFLVLVTMTFTLYYTPILRRHQIEILITASIVFYSWSSLYFLLLLIISALINALSSYFVFYGESPARSRLVAVSGVVANLSVLTMFKYGKLIYTSFFADILGTHGVGALIVSLPLPIGISFYTFQGISLVVDSFRKDIGIDTKVDGSKRAFFLKHTKKSFFFIIFFPHSVSGPIVKSKDFLPQCGEKRFSSIDWENVFRLIVIGYFLKSVVADNLKEHLIFITYPYFQSSSSLTLIVMLFGYSFQIFADFAGYSSIAIGIAALFGYRLCMNFNYPYISRSFAEFWRRWHMSLSSWLRDYLYIPLGGNKKGKARVYLNLMIVMFLGGLWHGAAWSYAIWGAFHGIALAIERLFVSDPLKESSNRVISVLRMLLVFVFVSFAWLLFRLPNYHEAFMYLRAIFENINLKNQITVIMCIFIFSAPVVVYHLIYLARTGFFGDTRFYKEALFPIFLQRYEYLIYGMMLFLLAVNSGVTGEFI
ncbi:MAG: MBOAT family protein, partial [Oligoflexales bacterium]|nr:MBOAT family protein [Oligoflexales bacterium]